MMPTDQIEITQLPDNLLNFSWGGSLSKKVIANARKLAAITWAVIFGFAFIVAAAIFLFTGKPIHLMAAMPIGTWLSMLSMPVLYSVLSRDVRVIQKGMDQRWFIDKARWWKKDVDRLLKEEDALYENGKRIHWLMYDEGKLWPFDPAVAELKNANGMGASAIAGIRSYTESVSKYSLKKTMSMQEAAKLGVLLGIIAIEMIGIFMLSGKLLDDNSTTTVQASKQEHVATAAGSTAD